MFHARDMELKEDIALKVLMPDWNADGVTAERFRNEVRLARKIAHPGVCRVFDMGEDGALRFLTMELIEGRTLRELMRAEKCSVRQAFLYLLKIADGLSAVHERGIVHRDLKPENILVRPDGQAVLVDFGLARDSFLPNRSSRGIAGTPRYMSPEQLRGERLDTRSDVFSFGVMAFELLTGRSPFGDGAAADVATAILRDSPLRFGVEGMPEGAVEAFQEFFEKALAKAPGQRFGGAGELGPALEEAWAGRSLRPVTKTPLPEVKKKRGWGTKIAWLGLVGAMGLGAMLGLTRERWKMAQWMEDRVVAPLEKIKDPRLLVEVRAFKNLSGDPKWDALAEGAGEEMRSWLRRSPRFRVMNANDKDPMRASVWVVEGNIQYVRMDDSLRISLEIQDTEKKRGVPISLELKRRSAESERLVQNARQALFDEVLQLSMERERNQKAIDGTQNEEARKKLLDFYELMGREPTTQTKNAGKLLLDEALSLDPNYLPALIERAYLFANGTGTQTRSADIDAGLRDLNHALDIDSIHPEALAMHCQVKRIEMVVKNQQTDETISSLIRECRMALAANPNSAEVRIALAHIDERRCDNARAIESLQSVLSDIDAGRLPGRPLPHILIQIVNLALQDGRLDIADEASKKLVAFENNKANGAPARRGTHLLRGAVLARLGKNDPSRVLEAKTEFIDELRYGNASPNEDWYVAGAIRGLMHIAEIEHVSIAPHYVETLDRIERKAIQAIPRDPSYASHLAAIYWWVDTNAAYQWLERGGPPASFGDVIERALLLRDLGRHTDVRKAFDTFKPKQQWETQCMKWILEK